MPAGLDARRGSVASPTGLVLGVCVLLAATAGLCLHLFGPYTGDSARYLLLAQNIADGNGFSAAKEPPYDPETFRGPLYPAFLALVLRAGGGTRSMITAQALLYLAAIALVFKIARAIGAGHLEARALCLLLAGYPPIVRWVVSLSAEALCTVLFAAACFFLVGYCQSPSGGNTAGLALTTAALFLTRAEYVVLLPVAAAIGALRWRIGSRRGVHTAMLLILMILPNGAWVLRNHTLLPHRFRPLGLGAGMTLWVRAVELIEPTIPLRNPRDADFRELHEGSNPVAMAEADDRLMRKALPVILEHWPAFVLGAVGKLAWREWVEVFAPDLPRIVLVAASTVSTSLLVLSYGGILLLARCRATTVWPLALFCFTVAATHAIGGTEARYTAPIRPVLYVFAAVMAGRVVQRLQGAGSPSAATTNR